MNILMLRHSAGFRTFLLTECRGYAEGDWRSKRLERHHNTPMRPDYG